MEPFNIVLIWAGQLGSRHLQGLSQISHESHITVIDPNPASLELAQKRYAECPVNPKIRKIEFVSDMNSLAHELDCVIIATNSMIRRQITEELLKRCRVKYLLLEKFLFPCEHDYTVTDKLLKQHKVETFVNCPRRLFPYYQRLKELLRGQKILSIRVSGANWGLGCNAIHFLDIITYLADSTVFDLDNNLEPVILNSKRPGYIEFAGTVYGKFDNGLKFEITSYPEGKAPILIEIQSEFANIVISESAGKLMYATEANQWSWQEEKIQILYQSGLSGMVVDKLLEKGNCELVPFDWSVKCHLKLLKLFLNHKNTVISEGNKELCPIT